MLTKEQEIHLLVSLFLVVINAPEFHQLIHLNFHQLMHLSFMLTEFHVEYHSNNVSISSFEMNKVNPFPTFMAPHSLFIFQTYLLTMRLP